MARLRRSDCSGPGIARRRRGRGFSYERADGTPVDEATRERIAALGIPPAWREVWVCPDEHGHLQATGLDARGRKQYLYHPRWREHRDRRKFEAMTDFARGLPGLRDAVSRDIALEGMPRERALATAVRLLDLGFFRIGGEGYAAENDSFGLATLRKEHVTVRGDTVVFDYTAKHGVRRRHAVSDAEAAAVIAALRRRRAGGPELLAFRRGRTWTDVRSADINEYLKEIGGEEVSAKVFRTWQGTVLAAVALAASTRAAGTITSRRRAKARAAAEVAHYLGNTPAIARAAYIDPRVLDAFDGGVTIEAAFDRIGATNGGPAIHGPIEDAVLWLLEDGEGVP